MRTVWKSSALSLAALCSFALGTVFTPIPERPQTPGQDTLTLHVSAQLVLVDASVQLRKTGETIGGLTPRDFDLEEDGTPQTISSLSEDLLPLSIVLLFDLTDTVHPVLTHLSDGAAAVLKHLRPQDEVAVMTFSSGTKLVGNFTHDRMTAVEGIDDAATSYDRDEPTFLFEDMWEAAGQSSRTQIPNARRVQIWITDGSANDQVSERHLAHHPPAVLHTEERATDALLHSDAVISALIERGPQPLSSGHYGDVERFAEMTGGLTVQASAGDVDARLAAMLDVLRQRYTLGFKPDKTKPDGTPCHLKVTLSPAFFADHPRLKAKEVVVRSRQTYVRQAAR